VSLLVLTGVSVNKTVDTSGTESGSSNTLALGTSPWAGFLAAAEGLDGTSDKGGFGSLLPLLRLASSSAAATRPGSIAASAVVLISVSVAIVSTVISTVAGSGAIAITVATTSDCADDSSKAC